MCELKREGDFDAILSDIYYDRRVKLGDKEGMMAHVGLLVDGNEKMLSTYWEPLTKFKEFDHKDSISMMIEKLLLQGYNIRRHPFYSK